MTGEQSRIRSVDELSELVATPFRSSAHSFAFVITISLATRHARAHSSTGRGWLPHDLVPRPHPLLVLCIYLGMGYRVWARDYSQLSSARIDI